MRGRILILTCTVLAACVAAAYLLRVLASEPRTLNSPPDAQPVAAAESEYIGSGGCKECHASQHQSYLKTAHSRALVDVNLAEEPAEAQFEHTLSGRSYRIYRQDGKLRHREWLTA